MTNQVSIWRGVGTYSVEPPLANNLQFSLDRVVLTPHKGVVDVLPMLQSLSLRTCSVRCAAILT